MYYKVEFDAESFPWWSGALDTIREISEAGKMMELENLIESVFGGEIPTETDINDFVWFESEYIYQTIGMLTESDDQFDEVEDD